MAVDWEAIHRVVEQHDTPFYLFERERLSAAIERATAALQGWGRHLLAYSVKTNSLALLLETVEAAGHGVDVASEMEYGLALAAGFTPDRIVFNGPLKAKGLSPECLSCRLINADSIADLEQLEQVARTAGIQVTLGLRICSPLTAPSWSRFGLNVEAGELEEGLRIVRRSSHLRLSGLHLHLGTQVEDSNSYHRAGVFLLDLWKDLGLGVDGYLDIGGGFWFDHSGESRRNSLREAVDAVADAWTGPRPMLVVEPGRVIAGPALTIVSRVIATKRRPREPLIVVLDTGTNHNISAAFFPHRIAYEQVGIERVRQRLVGPLCMEDDILSGEFEGPLPDVGSLCVMEYSGAYSLTFARHFIQELPDVLLPRRVINEMAPPHCSSMRSSESDNPVGAR